MPRVSKRAQLALRQARAAHGYARQQEAVYYEQVIAALRSVARKFTDLIAAATLVADGKPVDPAELAHIKTLWAQEVPDLAEAAASIYQSAGNALGRPVGGSITQAMRTAYLRNTAQRLTDVGDGLWDAATKSLSEGVVAGEDYAQLTDRLLSLFEEDGGTAVSEGKAGTITRTTVAAAVNGGTEDAMNQSDAPPQFKTWCCTVDNSTRPDHWEADGQIVAVDGQFEVGGEFLTFPGDPDASLEQTANCRCVLTYTDEPVEIPLAGRGFRSDEEIADVVSFFEDKGAVRTPGLLTAAADGEHTGGMIALVPTEADAARLAVDGGEAPADLHVTLHLLGEVSDIPDGTIAALRAGVDALAADVGPFDADAFAVSWFNPDGESPCWVLGMSGEGIEDAHGAVAGLLGQTADDSWECPDQYEPFTAHATVLYSDDPSMVDVLADRVGPVRFDRIRLALAGDNYDVPLTGELVAAADEFKRDEDGKFGEGPGEPNKEPERPTSWTDAQEIIGEQSFSDSQKEALDQYQSEGYGPINDSLREVDGQSSEDPLAVKELDAAFDSVEPLTEPITVERGMMDAEKAFGPVGSSVGSTFTDHGFVSTSTDPTIAEQFGSGEGSAIIRVEVPAGEKAIAMTSEAGVAETEREVLLPRSSTFEVTGDTVDADGQRVISVRATKP